MLLRRTMKRAFSFTSFGKLRRIIKISKLNNKNKGDKIIQLASA